MFSGFCACSGAGAVEAGFARGPWPAGMQSRVSERQQLTKQRLTQLVAAARCVHHVYLTCVSTLMQVLSEADGSGKTLLHLCPEAQHPIV